MNCFLKTCLLHVVTLTSHTASVSFFSYLNSHK